MENNTAGTVPTNNEEREATTDRVMRALIEAERGVMSDTEWAIVVENGGAAWDRARFRAEVVVTALAARRPPVSGDNAELIAEATRYADAEMALYHESIIPGAKSDVTHADNASLIGDLIAALSASQPRGAAPSDTDQEALAYAIWNAEGTLEPGSVDDRLAEWPNDREEYLGIAERVLAMLPLPFRTSQPGEAAPSDTEREALEQATLYGYQAVWDDGKFDADPAKNAWMWERVQIAVKAAVERAARPSHPVQVEVSDDMVDALDALPVGTVVGFVGGAAHREYAGSMLLWISTDGGRDQYARTLAHRRGALTVLGRPAAQHDGEFVETIRRHEREACALVAEKAWDALFETDQGYRVAKLAGSRIAAAIRAVPVTPSTPNQQGEN